MASKFPLEAVLRQRRRREEERQLELAALERELVAQKEARARLVETLERSLNQLREEQARPRLDMTAITTLLTYNASLKNSVDALEEAIARTEEKCQEARERLLQASKEVKAIEKLEEWWADTQRREWLRQEDLALAEAATSQFIRRLGMTG